MSWSPTAFPSKGRTPVNWDQVQGKWNRLKGSVKERWGKLTDDDLDIIAGKQDQLVGKIQERYGITREQAQREIELWWNSQPPTSETPETDKRRIA
jgi:uncharacterized protein YjbJ (UPF0337 family)